MRRTLGSVGLISLAFFACRGGGGGGGETPTPTPTPAASPTPTTGPVAVTAVDETNALQPGVDVFVQSSGGSLLQTLVTNSAGVAIAQDVVAGSMVTVARPGTSVNELTVQTITGVAPGDSLVIAPPVRTVSSVNVGSMSVSVPSFGGAVSYEVLTSCGVSSSGSTNIAISLFTNCVTSAGRFDFIGYAVDSTGAPIAYAARINVQFVDGGTITVPAWSGISSIAASFTNAPAQTTSVSYLESAIGASGAIPLVNQSIASPGPYDFAAAAAPIDVFASREQSAIIAFPGVGNYSRRSVLTFDGTAPIDTDLGANALPALISVTLDTSSSISRPSVLVVSSAGALADATTAGVAWTGASRVISWSVFGPGDARTFRYPELPAAYQLSPSDTPQVKDAALVESTVWAGYDAYRAAPETAFFIPSAAGRHRLSAYLYSGP